MDGFRDDGGGIGGFLPTGGGTFDFGGVDPVEDMDAIEGGRKLLRSCPTDGPDGAAPGGRGGARGAEGTCALKVSGSDRYGAWLSAPVFMPPAFLSFGIPPARMPASCGGPPAPGPSPPSLLLLSLNPPGTGGARPPDEGGGLGAIPSPGTGGAPAGLAGTADEAELSIIGADRSFT
jgi:hypothetical protein